MKKFLTTITTYALTTALALVLVNSILYSIPNDDYLAFEDYGVSANTQMLKQEAGNYDTLFIGDSRMKRGVIPEEFDAVVGTKSLNVAVAGMIFPRTDEYLEYILENHAEGLASIFIAFPDFYRNSSNFSSDPILYSVSFSDFDTVFNISRLPDVSIPMVHGMQTEYFKAMAYKYFGLGSGHYLKKILTSRSEALLRHDSLYFKYRGWLPFDEHAEEALEDGNEELAENLSYRQEQFGKNYDPDMANLKKGFESASSFDYSAAPIFSSTEEMLAIAGEFREKGIEVYFVIPPRMTAAMLVPVYSQLQYYDEYPVLIFSDPDNYPELYAKENGFDVGHLNTDGARIFSEYLAKEFLLIRQLQ